MLSETCVSTGGIAASTYIPYPVSTPRGGAAQSERNAQTQKPPIGTSDGPVIQNTKQIKGKQPENQVRNKYFKQDLKPTSMEEYRPKFKRKALLITNGLNR